MFTLYASTVYNIAIARSDTDIIINTVIILFICDIDEYFYAALVALSSLWKTNLVEPSDSGEYDESKRKKIEKRDSFDDVDNNTRDAQIDMLVKSNEQLKESNDDLKKRVEVLEKLISSSFPKKDEEEEKEEGDDDDIPLVYAKQDTFTPLNI